MAQDRKRDDAEPIIVVFITTAQAKRNKGWKAGRGKTSNNFETSQR